MDEAVLTQLKVLVESAVRPARCTPTRKRKAREELLKQLVQWYEEEYAVDADERAALERTAQRFGDPSDRAERLRSSLTWGDSIGWFFRYYYLVFLASRPGETRRHWIARQIGGVGLYLGVIALFCFLAISLITYLLGPFDRRPGWLLLEVAAITVGSCLWFFFITSIAIVLAHGLWVALYDAAGRSWIRATCLTAACSLVITAFALSISGLECLDSYSARARHVHYSGAPSCSEVLQKAFPMLPTYAVVGPYVMIFGLNLIWRIWHGPPGRPWGRTIVIDTVLGVALATLTYALGFAISRDLRTALANPQIILIVTFTWLLPVDLLLSIPKIVAGLREESEWENLQIKSV